MCTAQRTYWLKPRYPPPLPLRPHLDSQTRALLVSKDRRHLFVTPRICMEQSRKVSSNWKYTSVGYSTQSLQGLAGKRYTFFTVVLYRGSNIPVPSPLPSYQRALSSLSYSFIPLCRWQSFPVTAERIEGAKDGDNKNVWASCYIFPLQVRDSRKISCNQQISNTETTFCERKKNCIKAQFYFYKELRTILGNVVPSVHAVHFVLCCNLYLITAPPLLFSIIHYWLFTMRYRNAVVSCLLSKIFFLRKRPANNRWYSF